MTNPETSCQSSGTVTAAAAAVAASERERAYQMKMLDRAKKENVIVCLPTGSGKTFVAVNLIKDMLPAAIKDKKKIIFLANKVHLINQQGKYIQERVGETNTVAIITGELNTDFWKLPEWEKVLNKAHILVMISEIFKQIHKSAYIYFKDIALIIFDECHHAAKGDPMSRVIDEYAKKYRDKTYPRSDLPKILGLTATVINGVSKVEKIEEDIENIETKFCSKIITHTKYAELLGHSTSAEVKIKTYSGKLSASYSCCFDHVLWFETVQAKLASMFSINHKILPPGIISHPSYASVQQLFYSGKTLAKTLKAVLQDVLDAYVDLGPYCARLAARANLAFVQTLLLDSNCALDDSDDETPTMEPACIPQTREEMEKMVSEVQVLIDSLCSKNFSNTGSGVGDVLKEKLMAIRLVAKKLEDFTEHVEKCFEHLEKRTQIETLISDKLNKLIGILHQWRETVTSEDYDMCGIVFVKKRLTAQVLHWYFEDAKEHLGGKFNLLSTDFVVGCSSSRWGLNYENMHYTAKRQSEAMIKFKNNQTNLMFSTSVLEEGLDIRNCNLGVRFDRIENYPSYVQSMGRVRHPHSPFYVMLLDTDAMKQTLLLKAYANYHLHLQRFMIKKSIDQDDDDPMDFSDRVIKTDHGIKPFCPGGLPDSPEVTMDTAIQLVYRYCGTLPCDHLAPLSPYSWWRKISDQVFRAYVQLPSNSVITEVVEGPAVKGKKVAKQAVHLEACKKLYYGEALDDHLLPITIEVPKAANAFLEALQAEIREDGELANGKVGTKKRTQWYSKKVPDLMSRTISPLSPCFLYRIKFTRDENNNMELYNFENKRYSFGLIVLHELDMIPPFPLYGKFGEYGIMRVTLEKISGTFEFNAEQIMRLRSIQQLVFQKIVRLESTFLYETPEVSFLVSPLIQNESGSFEIFWDIADSECIEMAQFRNNPPSFQNRSNGGSFDAGKFNDAIILSCCEEKYEAISLTDLFAVMEVSNFTSKSVMDANDKINPSKTFHEHFQGKEGLSIKIMNPDFPLLKAKKVGKQLNFLSMKKHTPMSSKKNKKEVYLPPDLAVIYPIPASLFVQARYLPSCLQRISRLLLSREIQLSVASQFGWNTAMQNSAQAPDESNWIIHARNTTSFVEATNRSTAIKIGTGSYLATSGHTDYRNLIAPAQLEDIHPDKLTPEMVVRFGRKTKKHHTPRDPLNFVNDFKLSDIESFNFKSLDEKTDFSIERGPSAFSIMEALTLANAQDSVSMERLEFIGDSVLKLICSCHIYFHFPHGNEGQMTNLRSQLVSNANFYIRGKQKNLGQYLSGGIFIPDKTWMFPGVQLLENVRLVAARNGVSLDCFREISVNDLKKMSSDELDSVAKEFLETKAWEKMKNLKPANTTYSHTRVGDKNIADCVEALVGAYFINGGLCSALRFMDWLCLQAPTETGEILKLGILPSDAFAPTLPNRQADAIVRNYIPYIDSLEDRISYKFKNRLLVLEAFSYPDFVKNTATGCYQRLEFLGDSVLDFLIANYIYNDNVKDKTPGKLTLLKSALVNNFTLASLTVKYGFQKHLLSFFSRTFQGAIDAFVEYQDNHDFTIDGVLPLTPSTIWKKPLIAESLPVPKVLGDIFESLIGAIYIDCSGSLDTTWKIVYRLMETEITSFSKNIPKNVIMELYEKYPDPKPIFEVVVEDETKTGKDPTVIKLAIPTGKDPTVIKLAIPTGKDPTVIKLTIPNVGEFFGSGVNKKAAKQTAAQWALESTCSG